MEEIKIIGKRHEFTIIRVTKDDSRHYYIVNAYKEILREVDILRPETMPEIFPHLASD